MGTDLFNRLGFRVLDPNNIEVPITQSVNAVKAVPVVPPELPPKVAPKDSKVNTALHPIVAKFPSIRDPNPTKHIKHFQHRPRIDYSARPVVQAQRRIPLALLDKVEAELKRMQQCDVLEPIESSTWVSNMVVVPKSNGAVRICCDLSDLNKAVIPDRYPLPTIEELSRFFAGSRYFTKIDLKWGYLQVLLAPFSSTPHCNDHSAWIVSVEATPIWTQQRSLLLPNGNVHHH